MYYLSKENCCRRNNIKVNQKIRQFKKPLQLFAIYLLLSFILACAIFNISAQEAIFNENIDAADEEQRKAKAKEEKKNRISAALSNSKIPGQISDKIIENITEDGGFISDLQIIIELDHGLWILVDKEHALAREFEPNDLVVLRSASYTVNDNNLLLRRAAAASLEEMAVAARAERIVLVISYAYRSFARQTQSYEMHVRNWGQREADRFSARPGHSQHQLGTVVDFDSVTDAFARTPQGRWLVSNASRFGWSLSYPDGYEAITGYKWESWHYRYVGIEVADFIDKYFNGIQQYALKFIYEYINYPERTEE